jgi:hypothetical protein
MTPDEFATRVVRAQHEAVQLLAQEPPSFTTRLGVDITKHVPTIKVTDFHGTASGVRLVVTFNVDQHHEYEVLINPLYKEKTPCLTTPK